MAKRKARIEQPCTAMFSQEEDITLLPLFSGIPQAVTLEEGAAPAPEAQGEPDGAHQVTLDELLGGSPEPPTS